MALTPQDLADLRAEVARGKAKGGLKSVADINAYIQQRTGGELKTFGDLLGEDNSADRTAVEGKSLGQQLADIPGGLATLAQGAGQLGSLPMGGMPGPEGMQLAQGVGQMAQQAGNYLTSSPMQDVHLGQALGQQLTGENVNPLSPDVEAHRRGMLAAGSMALPAAAGAAKVGGLASTLSNLTAGAAASPDQPLTGMGMAAVPMLGIKGAQAMAPVAQSVADFMSPTATAWNRIQNRLVPQSGGIVPITQMAENLTNAGRIGETMVGDLSNPLRVATTESAGGTATGAEPLRATLKQRAAAATSRLLQSFDQAVGGQPPAADTRLAQIDNAQGQWAASPQGYGQFQGAAPADPDAFRTDLQPVVESPVVKDAWNRAVRAGLIEPESDIAVKQMVADQKQYARDMADYKTARAKYEAKAAQMGQPTRPVDASGNPTFSDAQWQDFVDRLPPSQRAKFGTLGNPPTPPPPPDVSPSFRMLQQMRKELSGAARTAMRPGSRFTATGRAIAPAVDAIDNFIETQWPGFKQVNAGYTAFEDLKSANQLAADVMSKKYDMGNLNTDLAETSRNALSKDATARELRTAMLAHLRNEIAGGRITAADLTPSALAGNPNFAQKVAFATGDPAALAAVHQAAGAETELGAMRPASLGAAYDPANMGAQAPYVGRLALSAPAKAATYGGLKWLTGWRQRAIDEAMQGVLTQQGPDAIESFLSRVGKRPVKLPPSPTLPQVGSLMRQGQ